MHQTSDPEGRPDRRLSSAVECMVAIKNFGATGRGAGKFQRGRLQFGPEIGKNVEVRQYTPAVGMRPSGLGSGRSPSSTFLRVWRTVRSSVGRTSQLPKRYWVSFAGPGHKGIVCLPAGMSFEADGLEHPDQIVEMARARDSAPTHAGEQLRDFQGQAPDFKGIVAAAMEMPQVRLIFWAPIGASGATRTSSAQRHQILDLGRRIYPKTRGRGRR